MTTVDEELRELLRERAVSPAAPPTRYETVRHLARQRQRHQLAVAAAVTGVVLGAAVGVPLALHPAGGDSTATSTAEPPHPPLSELKPVDAAVAYGSMIAIFRGRGYCAPEDTGVAWLADGRWRIAVWTPGPAVPSPVRCSRSLVTYTLRLPLPRPYAGEPVIDVSSEAPVLVNGGPSFLVPTYLPPGYTLSPTDTGHRLALAGPKGLIDLREGGAQMAATPNRPGWPYDVLGRPDINGHRGLLLRFRNDRGNTELLWTDGAGRGFALQVFSTALDRELVKIARSVV